MKRQLETIDGYKTCNIFEFHYVHIIVKKSIKSQFKE